MSYETHQESTDSKRFFSIGIAKLIGIKAACFLTHISNRHEKYEKNNELTIIDGKGYFYETIKDTFLYLGMTRHERERCIAILTNIGILTTKVFGKVPKTYFNINQEQLKEIKEIGIEVHLEHYRNRRSDSFYNDTKKNYSEEEILQLQKTARGDCKKPQAYTSKNTTHTSYEYAPDGAAWSKNQKGDNDDEPSPNIAKPRRITRTKTKNSKDIAHTNGNGFARKEVENNNSSTPAPAPTNKVRTREDVYVKRAIRYWINKGLPKCITEKTIQSRDKALRELFRGKALKGGGNRKYRLDEFFIAVDRYKKWLLDSNKRKPTSLHHFIYNRYTWQDSYNSAFYYFLNNDVSPIGLKECKDHHLRNKIEKAFIKEYLAGKKFGDFSIKQQNDFIQCANNLVDFYEENAVSLEGKTKVKLMEYLFESMNNGRMKSTNDIFPTFYLNSKALWSTMFPQYLITARGINIKKVVPDEKPERIVRKNRYSDIPDWKLEEMRRIQVEVDKEIERKAQKRMADEFWEAE